jgi:hypothetical protein
MQSGTTTVFPRIGEFVRGVFGPDCWMSRDGLDVDESEGAEDFSVRRFCTWLSSLFSEKESAELA